MTAPDSDKLRRIIVGRLESLQRAGVLDIPKGRPRTHPHGDEPAEPRPRAGVANQSDPIHTPRESSDVRPAQAASPRLPLNEINTSPKRLTWKTTADAALFGDPETCEREVSSAPTLEVLQQEVAACTRCNELACTRTQTVFGVGNPQTRLCFIGEAPGADEDRQGEPFVGRAGQLLNKIIEACKMRREDVYICNILKCRPPGNRLPVPAEVANCRRFLERQLELVQPEFICCLGACAAQNLLGTTQSIGKLRGKLHAYRGAKVVCTYHPAYLLRNPAAKKDTWEDMKMLLGEMGMDVA